MVFMSKKNRNFAYFKPLLPRELLVIETHIRSCRNVRQFKEADNHDDSKNAGYHQCYSG